MEALGRLKPFRAPQNSIGELDPEIVALLLMSAADIALILDDAGKIRDIAIRSESLADALAGYEAWVGKEWASIVAPDSTGKVARLLREAGPRRGPGWRHINHLTAAGVSIPVLYTAVPIPSRGHVVAFGRDLRVQWELQQRLLAAQHSLERDYSRLRLLETRFRMLFELSGEAVIILDGQTQRVAEANAAARGLLARDTKRLAGRPVAELFAEESMQTLSQLLASVAATGRADDLRAKLAHDRREVVIAASSLRQDGSPLFLLRLLEPHAPGVEGLPKLKAKLLKIVESAPDAVVVTGSDGQILTANAAFLDLVHMPSEQQVHGESLDRWLGRPGVDLGVMLAGLREHGFVRMFATRICDEYGVGADVEISAVAAMNGSGPCYGFLIRSIGQRPNAASPVTGALPRAVEQLTELVGRRSLKDLVRESTDLIERLCIETALEITGDNRASAAEMLGLSRQSLYTKLRRYGLGDTAVEAT
ncbi:MAG: transcriptional regulator PpsR [Proteobacteria bacterium]|nr:transcriptional regulator PpsR [Pseudomonadota bacterium]